MRPLITGAGAAGLFCLSFVATAVQAAQWNGSYSADGACYCSGELSGALSRRMAPTPIGGQSIAQICERVGEGPGLIFSGSRFSQPVYLDAQCGNGPFSAGTRPVDDSCAGTFDLAGKECVGIGPLWDMEAAYGVKPKTAAHAQTSSSGSPRVRFVGGSAGPHARSEETINRSSGSVYRQVAQSARQAVQGVVSASTASEATEPTIGAAGKTTEASASGDNELPIIDLGGVAYQLAPEGTPKKGGAAGSRIILDGKLYLKYVEGKMPKAVVADKDESPLAGDNKTVKKGGQEPARAAARQDTKEVARQKTEAKAIAKSKELARQKAQARTEARKQAAARKAKAEAQRLAAAKKAKADAQERAAAKKARAQRQAAAQKAKLAAQKSQAARAAESGQRATASRAEAREAARQARTEKLLADARKRLQRRNARLQAEAEALAKAKAAEQARIASTTTGTTEAGKSSQAGNSVASAPPIDAVESKTGVRDSEALARAHRPVPEGSLSRAQAARAVDETSKTVAGKEGNKLVPTLVNALRMPPATRTSSREFAYVDAMPISYAYGGGGVAFEASATSNDRIRYLARLGVANEYQEVLIGASVILTPANANRMTLVGTVGFEAGQFALEASDVSTTYDDTGVHVGVSSRLVLNNKFELQGGVGYSSFFDGDVTATAGGHYHLNRQLDIVSRFELGDNDSLGIGVRYYY